VFRRLMILAVAAAVFAVLAEAALGINVRVRVEGKTQTIYGGTQPLLSMPGTNALDALEAASARGEFYYHVTQFAFGPFVDQIGRFRAEGSSGWTFKVNGVSPPVGADKVVLREGQTVVWYWATFSEQGGPPTLLLQRTRQRNCYIVLAQDDQGRTQPANGAVLLVGGRRRSTRGGRACIGRHVGLVRAVRAGAVRSNALS
jgi:Domain of unknown function (DUF4430)